MSGVVNAHSSDDYILYWKSSKDTICEATLYANGNWLECLYIIAAVLFILSLKGLAHQETAAWGNKYGALGMTTAIAGAWASEFVCNEGLWAIAPPLVLGGLVGTFMASKVVMIQMPQMVGLLNAFGGLASALEAIGLFLDPNARFGPNGRLWVETGGLLGEASVAGSASDTEVAIQTTAMMISMIVGSVTFFGSLVACGKLAGKISSAAKVPRGRSVLTVLLLAGTAVLCWAADNAGYGDPLGLLFLIIAFVLAGLWGIMFTMAIGGADMPVVICVLNTGSGVAGVFAGFMLANKLLVITGTFVASSGVILSVIMCVAMNRSISNVLIGGFGDTGAPKAKKEDGEVLEPKFINEDELAKALAEAKSVIIVPGYGMAAAQAQHAVAAVTTTLRTRGVNVRFAIHPVAGRMPGHMNVLLAESKIPYDIVKDMDEINGDFPATDITLVVGANDTVNPAAEEDPDSAIAGMPVLQCWLSGMVVVNKRTMGTGYSGVDNPLFFKDNTKMFLGSAKQKFEELNKKLSDIAPKEGAQKAAEQKAEAQVEVKDIAPPTNPSLKVGILKSAEVNGEKRVALVPEAAARLVERLNCGIWVERGAGTLSKFQDNMYTARGCHLAARDEVIATCDVFLCVTPPPELEQGDERLKGKWVSAWIGRMTPDGKELVKKAADAGINTIDVTAVPRISIAQKLDVLSSQAKIAGHRAVLEAGAYYQRFFAPEITAAGKYPPCNVMILGVGVAGLAAIGTAVALGAQVRAWDVRDVSDQANSLGAKWITVDFKEDGAGEGGYAKESSPEFQAAQRETFHQNAKECDIIITTAAIPGRPSPKLIEDYMVKDMKPGSVIIDLGAIGGGNCTMTQKGEVVVTENLVTICGQLDFPSKMSQQASDMFAQNMVHMLEHVCKCKDKEAQGDMFMKNLAAAQKPEQYDDVVALQIVNSIDGKVVDPGKPPQPSPATKKPAKTAAPTGPKPEKKTPVWLTSQAGVLYLVVFFILMAVVDSAVLIELLMVFVLAAWIGYMLVWNVQPALHTPLMSVSNAISGQVVLGGIFMVSSSTQETAVFGGLAIFVASMNVFGGFVVTHRMLGMFKKE